MLSRKAVLWIRGLKGTNSVSGISIFWILFAFLKGDARRKKAIMKGSGLFNTICNGKTLLHYAALWWHPIVLQQLVNFGFDVNAVDKKGRLPLRHCIAYPENVFVLLQAGSNVNLPISGCIPLGYDAYSKLTALHLATAGDRPATIALLLKHGAKLDVKNSSGRYPRDYLRPI